MAVAVAASAVSTTAHSASTSSHTVTVPAYDAGDRLLLLGAFDRTTTITAVDDVGGSSWVEGAQDDLVNATVSGGWFYVDPASGNASSSAITVTTGDARGCVFRVLRVTGHADDAPESVVLEEPASTVGISPPVDFPELTPSWGAAETLWVYLVASDEHTSAASTFPSGYSGNDATASDAASFNCSLSSGYKVEAAASEDPSGLLLDVEEPHVVYTIGVRPLVAVDGGSASILLAV